MLPRVWRWDEYREHTQHSEQNFEKTLENDMVRDWSRGKIYSKAQDLVRLETPVVQAKQTQLGP